MKTQSGLHSFSCFQFIFMTTLQGGLGWDWPKVTQEVSMAEQDLTLGLIYFNDLDCPRGLDKAHTGT